MRGAGDDDLQTNSFFKAFQNMPEFNAAAKNKLVVCVPVEESLKAATLNKEFIYSHVLKQSPYFQVTLLILLILQTFSLFIALCWLPFPCQDEMISLDNKVAPILRLP